jgi:hypothetical protein
MSSPYIKTTVNRSPPDRKMSREEFIKWYYNTNVSEDKYKNSLKRRLR